MTPAEPIQPLTQGGRSSAAQPGVGSRFGNGSGAATHFADSPQIWPKKEILSPPRRLAPLPYGLVTGIAAIGSVALILCCIVSVGGKLGPGRRYINRTIATVSVASGIFVGIRSYHARRLPRRESRGRCPDCGRELLAGDEHCGLCGRPTDAKVTSPDIGPAA